MLLSDTELADLQAELPTKWRHYIDRLSEYMATGKEYKNHLATIRRWAADDGKHWTEVKAEGQGLLFWGGVGTGKTFAAACIADAFNRYNRDRE